MCSSETSSGARGGFTNPFRYIPHPLVVKAAEEVMERIDSSEALRSAFSEGKMLGVLLVELPSDQPLSAMHSTPHAISNSPHVIPNSIWDFPALHHLHYIAAFSGSIGGRSIIEGFVPPIFDLLEPSGHFKEKEAEISAINQALASEEFNAPLINLKKELAKAEKARDGEINRAKEKMAESKRMRDEIRARFPDSTRTSMLIAESQHEKAELKRLKASWEARIEPLRFAVSRIEDSVRQLKAERSRMSDELQEWIFGQYIVHNACGEESSVLDIFRSSGLTPPGGTGDCAAPKLLEYAFRNGLRPVAMGEFWYGKSPETAVRTHGHFYPSCTGKCGPLLGWMMRGLGVSGGDEAEAGGGLCGDGCGDGLCGSISPAGVDIIYEDEVLVAVDKPSGMPSVPGLDGRVSAMEVLERDSGKLHVVHRLDMDTSGILLFAKTQEAAVLMQRQFEDHTVRKTYRARLAGAEGICALNGGKSRLAVGDRGRIELPLSPDYDERPRQKVDFAQGKTAVTEYEVTGVHDDGTVDILFFPHTGRTHQLRVHAAHILGLGRPILGDLLYGGAPLYGCNGSTYNSASFTDDGASPKDSSTDGASPSARLQLYATAISFRHPATGEALTLTLPR